MTRKNFPMKERFFTHKLLQCGRDWGHRRNSLTWPWLLLRCTVECLETLNIPSGWRHPRKPPCGQVFNISGRFSWAFLLVVQLKKQNYQARHLQSRSPDKNKLWSYLHSWFPIKPQRLKVTLAPKSLPDLGAFCTATEAVTTWLNK